MTLMKPIYMYQNISNAYSQRLVLPFGSQTVNLQYITLGYLDDGTNESSTKSPMFQVLFFYTFHRLFIFIFLIL